MVSLKGQGHLPSLPPIPGPRFREFSTRRNCEIEIVPTPLSRPQSPQEENGLSGLQGSCGQGSPMGKARERLEAWPKLPSWRHPFLPQVSSCQIRAIMKTNTCF